MQIEHLEPIAPDTHISRIHLSDMLGRIGSNVFYHNRNFPDKPCESVTIVDVKTGERVRLTFDVEEA